MYEAISNAGLADYVTSAGYTIMDLVREGNSQAVIDALQEAKTKEQEELRKDLELTAKMDEQQIKY